MKKELLEKAKKSIQEEIRRAGFIDDSDFTDRFLDFLARELAKKEILKGNDDIEFYYEKEVEIDEAKEELLDLIKNEIMNKYNRFSFINERGDFIGCYYKTKKGLKRWAECLNITLDF